MTTTGDPRLGLPFYLEQKLPFIARIASGEWEGDLLRGMFLFPVGRRERAPSESSGVLLLDIAPAVKERGDDREYDLSYHLSDQPMDRALLQGLEELQLEFCPPDRFDAVSAAMFGVGKYPGGTDRGAFRFVEPFVRFMEDRTPSKSSASSRMSLESASSWMESTGAVVTLMPLLADGEAPLWTFSGHLRDALAVVADKSFEADIDCSRIRTLEEFFRVLQVGDSMMTAAWNPPGIPPAGPWGWWS